MNKADLIDAVAVECDLSRSAAQRAFDSIISNIGKTLKKGGSVQILGFGTFTVAERAERVGRNMKTNQPVLIPARRVPKFVPGKNLKELVE